VLLHFYNDVDGHWHIETRARDVQRLVNRRLLAFSELDIDSRTNNL
jgi:hypothetical protein